MLDTSPVNPIKTIESLIRTIPDFPKPGILFYDLMPIFADAQGLALAAKTLAAPWKDEKIDKIVAAESRGFIIGVAVARQLNAGFIPVRKPGKLPGKTISEQYELEYGFDQLEMHADAIEPGQRILMIDDLLATGGTMNACCKMVEQLGGRIIGISFLVELPFLNGRQKLPGYRIETLISFDSE